MQTQAVETALTAFYLLAALACLAVVVAAGVAAAL
jgi:hypothetical protein